MTTRQARWVWGVVLAAAGWCIWAGLSEPAHSQNQTAKRQANGGERGESPEPATLLPRDSVLFVGWDGHAAHQEAWEQTAAHAALYESGLMPALWEAVAPLVAQLGPDGEKVRRVLRHIDRNGLSLSVAVPKDAPIPLPVVTLVLHEGAELEPLLGPAIRKALRQTLGEDVLFDQETVSGRKLSVARVPVPNGPVAEIGWWIEGGHLVFVAGLDAAGRGIAVAAGEQPNLTTHALWKKFGAKPQDFERSAISWFQPGPVLDALGNITLHDLPPDENGQPPRLAEIFAALGLDSLDAAVYQSGYRGKAQWSETRVLFDGERRGLFDLAAYRPVKIADLPKLPVDLWTFSAGGVDSATVYDNALELAGDLARFLPASVRGQVQDVLDDVPGRLGFDPKADILAALGPVVVTYNDMRQVALNSGTTFAVEVRDRDKLAAGLKKMQQAVSQRFPAVQFETHRRGDRELVMGQFVLQGSFPVAAFAYSFDEDWLAVGSIPQTIDAFFLRQSGAIESTTAAELTRGHMDGLPEEFGSLNLIDPRQSVGLVAGLLPVAAGIVKGILVQTELLPEGAEVDINVAALPPAELVVRPLFPNVSVGLMDGNDVRSVSRSSVADASVVAVVAVVGVGAALLLPAVGQARQAARRTQSQGHLKNMALAIHNEIDANNGRLPRGTIPNEKLKPEKRLSWLVSILEEIDQTPLARTIDRSAAWDAETNETAMRARIDVFINPGVDTPVTPEFGPTHYVGIAGHGKDCATLPAGHARAGVFGYDRVVKLADVADGTSNTLMVSEAHDDFGAWGAGGTATVRGFVEKPYVDGPDGIGSPWPTVFQAALVDGSVRALSKDIDPEVLEKLSTYNGQKHGEAALNAGDF